MKFTQTVLIVIVTSLSSLVSGQTETENERIAELESRWSNLYGERNLEEIVALMAQNSVLIMPGAAPIVGIEEIRHATRAMLESDDEVSWKSDFAFVSSSGDMAYDYGTAMTTLADGSSAQGYYLVVWVKENGQWRVAADMFN